MRGNATDQRACRPPRLCWPARTQPCRRKPLGRPGGRGCDRRGGHFAGFRGTVQPNSSQDPAPQARPAAFDHALDEVLRSPLDQIIESAERIVDRADGPLRSDYASYGNDIAAAARHLLSVLTSMNDRPAAAQRSVDLAALAGEAIVMLDEPAEERKVTIAPEGTGALLANGEERGVIQILVNLIGNAIRHSPEGGTVRLQFAQNAGTASVAVATTVRGLRTADQQRIFERFERADDREGGTGLGLAISRRLGTLDGRRRDARKHARRGRAVHVDAAVQPSACRRASSRAESCRCRAGAAGRFSAQGRRSSRSIARPSRPCAPARTAR